MRKFHLITYGCQMNKNDSERIATVLSGLGFTETTMQDDADFILMNTCSVRQTAEDRVFGNMVNFKQLKERKPELVVGVTGCMPGRDRDGKLRAKMPDADLFFPTADLPRLPGWLAGFFPELVNTTEIAEDYLKLRPLRKGTRQAYVTIQTGCNKFCTYCVVPFSRGLERNRPVADILDEIRELAAGGCVEVTLLGQTVNSYRAPDSELWSFGNPYHDHFAALLWEVNQIIGIRRVHYTAPHPLHMTDEVIDALTLPRHVNFLHLPVQSGDNEILRRMNRRYTVEQYRTVIEKIRAKKSDIAIGTDIIVGFCGETTEQFERTIALYKEVGFDISYNAMYSSRSGTAAHRAFKDDVPRDEKRRRWNALQKVMEEIVFLKNQRFVGETIEVMVEKWEPLPVIASGAKQSREEEKASRGLCSGNSREMKVVQFIGSKELVGIIVMVKIKKAREWILEGEFISSS